MTREIPLTQGYVALVDDADYDRIVSMGSWQVAKRQGRANYAYKTYREGGRKMGVLMHTAVTGWPYVDHVNGDGLDNRRTNMREATHAQNMANRPMNSNNKSGYKGVCWNKAMKRWQAQLKVNGRRFGLGYYNDPAEAARAYDSAALEHLGTFAYLNFPQETR